MISFQAELLVDSFVLPELMGPSTVPLARLIMSGECKLYGLGVTIPDAKGALL